MNLDDLSADTRRRVGTWLALWAGMVLLLVLIGGATRLTESGLSITEWKPVTGVLPPASDMMVAFWAAATGPCSRMSMSEGKVWVMSRSSTEHREELVLRPAATMVDG